MKYCKNCANAIFDQVFGSYKCGVSQVSVDMGYVIDCRDYEKGNPTVSKDFPEGYVEEEDE